MSGIWVAVSFLAVSTAVFLYALQWLLKRTRRGRDPVNKGELMLRQAGEGLRDKIDAKKDEFVDEVINGMFVPVVVALVPGTVLYVFRASTWTPWLAGLVGVGFLISFALRLRRATGLLEEIRNLRLGLVGERLVAGKLEELAVKGYHVYHDAQAQGAKEKFNIDHLVVGRTGVYVVETKMRRKPEGKDSYKVEYNGSGLVWPAGVETDSTQQVCHNARWLQDHLRTKLGLDLEVKPLLVIPGWFVTMPTRGAVMAVNHKQLEGAMSGPAVLDARTVDLVRRQLEALCRDVPT